MRFLDEQERESPQAGDESISAPVLCGAIIASLLAKVIGRGIPQTAANGLDGTSFVR